MRGRERTGLSLTETVLRRAWSRLTLKERRSLRRRKLKTAGGTGPSKLIARKARRESWEIRQTDHSVKNQNTSTWESLGVSQFAGWEAQQLNACRPCIPIVSYTYTEAHHNLRLEPPAWVIIAQEYTLIHSLQPIIAPSPIPTFIFPLKDVP